MKAWLQPKQIKHAALTLSLVAVSVLCQSSKQGTNISGVDGYHVIKRIPLPGPEQCSDVAVDAWHRRVFLSRKNHVTVLDADSGRIVGNIRNMPGVHDVRVVPETARGFASTAGNHSITVFDTYSLQKLFSVPVSDAKSNDIAYDPVSNLIFELNRSQSIIVLAAADGKVVANKGLVDNAEAAISDSKGHLYTLLADPAEIAVIDTSNLALTARIQLAPCVEPRGISMDINAHRLFVGCSSGTLIVIDPDAKKTVTRISLDNNIGDVQYDNDEHLVFALDTSGNIFVVRKGFPDHYTKLGRVPTGLGPSTMALDVKMHRILVAPRERARASDAKVLLTVVGRR